MEYQQHDNVRWFAGRRDFTSTKHRKGRTTVSAGTLLANNATAATGAERVVTIAFQAALKITGVRYVE